MAEEPASATRASRRSIGAPVVGVDRAEEVGRAGTEEGSSSLDVAGNVRLGGSVSEDRVGKGKPENPRSLGGKGGLGVGSVGESEPGGSSSLRDTSQGGEVWRSNGVSVAGDQHVEHLDSLDGTNSNTDGCGSATRVEFDTHLSPTASLNDYPRPVAANTAAATFPLDSAAAGLDGLPPPTATPGLNTSIATVGTGARQAGVVVDGGSKPRDERTVSPASGEEVKPEEEEEDRVSIATGNEEGSAVPEVEDEPEVRQDPVPAALLHPPPAAASLATEPRCGQTHLPLEPNEATRETPPPSVDFEGGTEIARVPNPSTREEGDGVVSTPLRHRGPLEEDSQVNAKREEDEEKEEEEVEAEAEVEEEEGEGRGQGEKKEGWGGGGEEEVLEEDVSGQQQETNGAVETMEEGLRFTVGRVNDRPEGGKDVSGAAARFSVEKRRGEEVTDPGTEGVPFVLPKNEEGEGEVAEGDCAEGLSVEREEGECDREALVLGAEVAVDGRVKEELVEENSGSMGPLVTAVVPQGKPQQQQEQQQEEDGEGEGEKEVEEERETETLLILGTDMAVDDHVKEEPVGEDSEPMCPLDDRVKEEPGEEGSGPVGPLVSAAVPQGKQQEQEQEQQEEEQEQEGEKKVEEEEGRGEQEQEEQEEGEGEVEKEGGGPEEAEEEQEEQEEQEGGLDEEGAGVDGEDVAVGDNTPAATNSPVNDQVAEQKTSGLPVALPISHEGGGGTDDENVGEDGVEEGEEASTVGVGDATAGPGNATDSFRTTALVSAGEGVTAEDAVEGEGSCSHEAGTKALDTAIDSIAQAPDCKEGATQDDDLGEKAAAAEGEGPCTYEEGSDALGLLVDAAGGTQHEQEERKPQEAEENPAPSCGTAAGTASENNGRGDTIAAGSGGVEGATVDAPMGRVDETAPTMGSDSEALDSRAGGSPREASGGNADGGRNKSNWLAALKELVEKGGSCCH